MNDKQIKALNNVIEAAIEHGGDYGGAYYCYAGELADAMDFLIATINDSDYYWEWKDGQEKIPIVVKRSHK